MIEIVEVAAKKVGGLAELGRLMGISRNAFYRWREVPPKRVLQLEKISGISRHEMRPDLYPPDERKNP